MSRTEDGADPTASVHDRAEERAIEVKGRAGGRAVEALENERAKACNLRERYWLYVVFDCPTSQRRLIEVQDPFGRLAKAKGSMLIPAAEIFSALGPNCLRVHLVLGGSSSAETGMRTKRADYNIWWSRGGSNP